MGALRTETGEIVWVPDDEEASRVAAGYTPVAPAEAGAAMGQRVYEDKGLRGAVGAGSSGLLSGATLGGSDLLLKGLFLNDEQAKEVLRDREAHPWVSGSAQMVGAVLPALAGGGVPAAAGGTVNAATAGATGAGVSLLPAAAASATGRAVTGALAPAGAGLGRTALAHAAGAAVEGGAFAGSQYLAETALADKEASAEGFFGAAGHGALFGAALGGGLTLGEAALIKAKSLFPKHEVNAEAAKGVEREASAGISHALEDGDQMVAAAQQKLAEAKTPVDVPIPPRDAAGMAADDIAEAQARMAAEVGGTSTAVTAPSSGSVSVPSMVTQRMEQQLRDLGYTAEQIAEMKPAQAWEAINKPSTAQPSPAQPAVTPASPTITPRRAFTGEGTPSPVGEPVSTKLTANGEGIFAKQSPELYDLEVTLREFQDSKRNLERWLHGNGDPEAAIAEGAKRLFGERPTYDADLEEALRRLNPDDVLGVSTPDNEFGASRKGGRKSQAELEADVASRAEDVKAEIEGTRAGRRQVPADELTAPGGKRRAPAEQVSTPYAEMLIERSDDGVPRLTDTSEQATAAGRRRALPPDQATAVGKRPALVEDSKLPDLLRAFREAGEPLEGQATRTGTRADITGAGDSELPNLLRMFREAGEPETGLEGILRMQREAGQSTAVGESGTERALRMFLDAGESPSALERANQLFRDAGEPETGLERMVQMQREASAYGRRRGSAKRATLNEPVEGFAIDKSETGTQVFRENPKIREGVPTRRQIKRGDYRDVAYVVKPSELAARGVRGTLAEGGERVQGVRDSWAKGESVPAVEIDIDKAGDYYVVGGDHRLLAAAADGDRPVLVRFRPVDYPVRGADDLASALKPAEPAPTMSPEDASLEALLRGTKQALDEGGSIRAIGEASPARAEYVANKAETRARQAAEFRDKANAKNYAGSDMAAAEREANTAPEAQRPNTVDDLRNLISDLGWADPAAVRNVKAPPDIKAEFDINNPADKNAGRWKKWVRDVENEDLRRTAAEAKRASGRAERSADAAEKIARKIKRVVEAKEKVEYEKLLDKLHQFTAEQKLKTAAMRAARKAARESLKPRDIAQTLAAAAVAMRAPVDPKADQITKVGKREYIDGNGEKFTGQPTAPAEAARQELASDIYGLLGEPVVEVKAAVVDGEPVLLTKQIEGKRTTMQVSVVDVLLGQRSSSAVVADGVPTRAGINIPERLPAEPPDLAAVPKAEVQQQLKQFAEDWPRVEPVVDGLIEQSKLSPADKTAMGMSLKERADWLMRQAETRKGKELSGSEMRALTEDRGEKLGASTMAHLRNGETVQGITDAIRAGRELTPSQQEFAAAVDRALVQMPVHRDTLLYRTLDVSEGIPRVGETLKDPGYMSASARRRPAGASDIVLHISVPEGYPVAAVPGAPDMVLPRNAELHVDGMDPHVPGRATVVRVSLRPSAEVDAMLKKHQTILNDDLTALMADAAESGQPVTAATAASRLDLPESQASKVLDSLKERGVIDAEGRPTAAQPLQAEASLRDILDGNAELSAKLSGMSPGRAAHIEQLKATGLGDQAEVLSKSREAYIERLRERVRAHVSKHNGKDVDIGPDLAHAAKIINEYEEAGARLADKLGEAAPPSAKARAQAYRAATSKQAESMASSSAKAAEDIQSKLQPKLDTATGGAGGSWLVKAAMNLGTGLEVLKEMGVHVPALSDIPVIGPLLGAFLKAKAVYGILKRKGGGVLRSTEGIVASKSAETMNRINTAAREVLEKGARGMRKASVIAAPAAAILSTKLFPGGEDDHKTKDLTKLYNARMDELSRALAPGAIEHAIADRMPTSNPELQDALAAQARRGLEFLSAKAPRPGRGPGMMSPDGTWKPSKAVLDVWAKYVAAVNNPAGVLEDLVNGHVSREGAEALRVVYPKLFAQAQRTLIEMMPTFQRTLPYPRRVAISITFGIPVDTSMQQSHMQFLIGGQQPVAPAAPPPPQTGPAITGPFKTSTLTAIDRRSGA